MRRRNLVVVMVGAVLVSSASTWVATEAIQSPAEIAARTAAPKPTPILVPVERKVLDTEVVTRGTARFGSPRKLSIARSALKSAPQVVTRLPSPNETVRAGEVLMEVSGRPVFLLRGAQPSYRDLGPGMVGADVRQLERALRRLGLQPGGVDGVYDAATGAAVTQLYERHGHQPLVADEAQLAAARPVEAGMVAGATASAGVQLPADEVVFAPNPPLRVTSSMVRLGAAPEGAVLAVTDSRVVVDGFLPVEQAGLVKERARVVIDEPALNIDAQGSVARVAGRPGTSGADGFHVHFRVHVTDPVPAMIGTSLRLTVPIRSTEQAELTVPVSAVSLGPDGGSRVQKQNGDGFEFVPVDTGLSAQGYVVVRAAAGKLDDGDLVVVGLRTSKVQARG